LESKFLSRSALTVAALLLAMYALPASGATTQATPSPHPDLSNTYGLVFVPEASNPITTGSNVWLEAWTANTQVAEVTFSIASPHGHSTPVNTTLLASLCTIPLLDHPSGKCAIDEIPSVSQGNYKVQVFCATSAEVLKGCVEKGFNVVQGTSIVTPAPAMPLNVAPTGNNTYGMIFNPAPPEKAGAKIIVNAWTAKMNAKFVIFTVKGPGGSLVNTSVDTLPCAIYVSGKSSGMCAQIQIGPLLMGDYSIQSTFIVSGNYVEKGSVYQSFYVNCNNGG